MHRQARGAGEGEIVAMTAQQIDDCCARQRLVLCQVTGAHGFFFGSGSHTRWDAAQPHTRSVKLNFAHSVVVGSSAHDLTWCSGLNLGPQDHHSRSDMLQVMDAAMMYSQAEDHDEFRNSFSEQDVVHWPLCLDEAGVGSSLAVACAWRIVDSLHGTGSKLLHSKLVPFLPVGSDEGRLAAPDAL